MSTTLSVLFLVLGITGMVWSIVVAYVSSKHVKLLQEYNDALESECIDRWFRQRDAANKAVDLTVQVENLTDENKNLTGALHTLKLDRDNLARENTCLLKRAFGGRGSGLVPPYVAEARCTPDDREMLQVRLRPEKYGFSFSLAGCPLPIEAVAEMLSEEASEFARAQFKDQVKAAILEAGRAPRA